MDNNYISASSQFEHMEGNSIDFKKTFDLNGTSNDDMLRLYLRKAGLSDEIECLSPEQRRAFIYDIIKSNKMPGYWMPSTMKTTSLPQQAPAARSPPHLARQDTNSVMAELRNEPTTPTLHYATMSTSSSTGSLSSMGKNSPLMSQRFAQPRNVPSSPTTIVKNKKGLKYEISGPINFTHVSGDMTRDMTKKAFDLTLTMNDNVLKKYLMERGIKDEELTGMGKQDLIRKIVQSNYTWVPPGHNQISKNQHQYVARTNQGETSPTSPAAPSCSTPSTPLTPQVSTSQSLEKSEPLSNFALVTSRFVDSSQFPSPDTLFSNVTEPNPDVALRSRLPSQAMRLPPPPPPPRKHKNDKDYDLVPPPPSFINAAPNLRENVFSKFSPEIRNETISQIETNQLSENIENFYEVPISQLNPQNDVKKPIVPKNPYIQSFITGPDWSQNNTQTYNANQDKALEAPPTYAVIKPKTIGGPPPPPPPPMPNFNSNTDAPVSPLFTQTETSINAVLIPPPPQMLQNKINIVPSSSPNQESTGDSKEDFLESIRKGVTLKKVEKKGATIGGFKPRPVRKLPIPNFQPAPSPMQSKNSNSVPSVPPPMPKNNINNGILPSSYNGPPLSPNNGAPPPPPPPPPLKESNSTIPNMANSGDSRDAYLESIRNGIALKKVDKKGATISGIKPRAELKPPVTDFLSELKMGITLRRVKNPNDNIFADGVDESDA